MTRTISLIIGIAVVALVAVPTAFGEGRLAGSPEPDAVASFYANERSDARGPAARRRQQARLPRESTRRRGTWTLLSERPRISQPPSETVLLSGDDHVIVRSTESPTVTASGRDVEWPQVGIGFGIGIALASPSGSRSRRRGRATWLTDPGHSPRPDRPRPPRPGRSRRVRGSFRRWQGRRRIARASGGER